jgi:hypothetical protein
MSTSTESTPGNEDQAKERKKRGGLARWIGRADNANDWYQVISSFVASKTGAATVTLGLAAAGAGGAAIVKPDFIRGLLKSDVEVATERWGDSSVVYPIEGVDKAGRRARFDVVLLTKQYTWLWGSDVYLMKDALSLSQDEIVKTVLGGELKAGLSRSSEVIAVGVASQEGATSTELTRAQRRAETSAKWLKQVLPPTAKVSLLNLGQYKADCGAAGQDSSWQRPFMTIGVREQDQGVVLTEALADALSGKTNMPGPACYTSFELTKQG